MNTKTLTHAEVLERAKSAAFDHDTQHKAWGLLLDLCELDNSNADVLRETARVAMRMAQFHSDPERVKQWYEVYWRAMRLLAWHDLDAFFIYVERYRNPEDRFYGPRRRVLYRLVVALMKMENDELDELIINMPARVGKLLSDDTPVLTTKGWKRHGDLRVGDFVYSPEGHPVEIYHINPKHHTTHTVRFTDGSEIKCHYNHEWHVYDRSCGKYRLLETHEMIGRVKSGKDSRRTFLLPPVKPLDGPNKKLPVAPYVLGAWLGDGSTHRPRITNSPCDYSVIDAVQAEGYAVEHVYDSVGDCVHTDFGTGLRSDLQKLGMCHSRENWSKRIPVDYLTASKAQRLELLAGLLDTDGTLVRKERRYQFSTTNEELMHGVKALISTFGWRVSISSSEPKLSSSGVQGKKVVYTLGFNPKEAIPCRLERKQLHEFSKESRIAIDAIYESEQEPGNCISVDGGMYLAGDTLKPTHNTTMLLFFLLWVSGRNPERTNLYVAYSSLITDGFYEGLKEILTDDITYAYHEIFSDAVLVDTDAKNTTLDLGRKKRYATLTCRSLYGSLNGTCDCNGYLVADDLLSGASEARSATQLSTAQFTVSNNMLRRVVGKGKVLWCGTPWSIRDPMGNRLWLLKNDPEYKDWRWEHIAIPALDKNDESNFDYDFGRGFSTKQFKRIRAEFLAQNDEASWETQCQCNPIERHGLLFQSEQLRTYNGVIPDDEEIIRIVMVCDPAWGGGDYAAAAVGIITDKNKCYIPAAMFSNAEKTHTQPRIVSLIWENKVSYLEVEANKMTRAYADDISDMLEDKSYPCNVTTLPASNKMSKVNRIMDKAPQIREFIYLEESKRDVEYKQFMQNVLLFNPTAPPSSQHEDAPDCLAMLVNVFYGTSMVSEVEVIASPI